MGLAGNASTGRAVIRSEHPAPDGAPVDQLSAPRPPSQVAQPAPKSTKFGPNDIVGSVLPPFEASGDLPCGVHTASWDELCARFGDTPKRAALLEGLLSGAQSLHAAGVRVLWVGGSFVTNKAEPGDFDAAWDMNGIDGRKVDPLLIDFDDLRSGRLKQKAKFGGEFLPGTEAKSGLPFQAYLQQKSDGGRRGIVRLDLRTLP